MAEEIEGGVAFNEGRQLRSFTARLDSPGTASGGAAAVAALFAQRVSGRGAAQRLEPG